MRLLVTGCAGYIGATFCYEQIKKGVDIIGVDDLSNSDLKTVELIKNLSPGRFKFIKESILEKEKILNQIDPQKKIDAIFHFAALKSIPESEKNPKLYFENNVTGTQQLVQVAKKLKIKKFIFSSSAAVYGDKSVQPIDENQIPDPKNIYAETKMLSEELIMNAAQKKIFKAISLRYFNPVGSHDNLVIYDSHERGSSNLMPAIMETALGKRKFLEIYGNNYDTEDGTAERDYIHISDLIEGHIHAFKKIESLSDYDTFNLGTGKSTSVLELINIFEKISGQKIRKKFTKPRAGDSSRCYAKINKAKEVLGWVAKYSLEKMCNSSWEAAKG